MVVSELQLALIGGGAALVAGVWAYNLWQEHQHKKVAEKIFKGGQEDVLLQGQEDVPAEPVPPVRHEPAGMAEPVLDRVEPMADIVAEDPAVSVPPDERADVPPPPADWADAIADCTVRVDFAQAIAAPDLWAAQAGWGGGLGKPLAWMGYAEGRSQWRTINAHSADHYAAVAASLQLADRRGAVGETDLAAFLDGMHRLAQHFSGLVTLPASHEVLTHARALDEFCAGVDVQLGVNVVDGAGNAFAGTKLRGLAEAAGMELRGDGLFHALDDYGATLFTLGNLGPEVFDADVMRTLTTAGVTFMLDVPRVADGPVAFDRMVAAARQMAQSLGGTLVDGQRHALSDAMIAGIRAKIGEIQQQMAVYEIAPGSVRALRLFS
ncbi:MAG: cell division protein ZipA C-terminal FtsZ-binding domain-containing protein [Sterolibacteriaceae bacterium MAG5]|nr:cell division protein ZipA C-terminal FtsZ-binding domain-containing protein [Candidatus Nitricoxidireducens bremensis]